MTRRGADGDPPSRGSLLRVLGVAFGLAVLVGNTIGMGILRTPGEVAARLPSVPLFMAVWILGAVYAFLGALTVAELAAMRPRSGGLYPLVHDALGEYPGFIVGWTDWLATCGSMAAVAMVFGEYVGSLVPGAVGHEAGTASGVIVTFGVLQWRGVRIGDVAQQLTSLLKSIALIGLAVVALVTTVDPVLAAPVTPLAMPTGLAFAGAIVIALQSAIYTYDGWTGPIYFGEELRDPPRDIPRAMIGGVVLVLVIYLSLNAAFLRVVPIREMAGDPFVAATAASRLFGSAGDVVLRVVMLLSLVATINALQLMASRVPFAMSRDRLLPAVFQRVNPGGTPVPALIASTVIVLVCIATNTFNTLLAMLAFLFVANYALVFSAFFVSRRRTPHASRPFRVPGYPFVP
ncbi:MAG TPA: APC family permease, partial [Vicinamibacterales bacterium]|nr:APC family permease [Vicinamibacterales bacterium]